MIIVYDIFDTTHSETFVQSKVSSNETTALCPEYVFSVVNFDKSNIDTTIFNYDMDTSTLKISSLDVDKADAYYLTL